MPIRKTGAEIFNDACNTLKKNNKGYAAFVVGPAWRTGSKPDLTFLLGALTFMRDLSAGFRLIPLAPIVYTRCVEAAATRRAPAVETDARLEVIAGPLSGKTFPINREEVSIGREPSNEISFLDSSVSRRHCSDGRARLNWS